VEVFILYLILFFEFQHLNTETCCGKLTLVTRINVIAIWLICVIPPVWPKHIATRNCDEWVLKCEIKLLSVNEVVETFSYVLR